MFFTGAVHRSISSIALGSNSRSFDQAPVLIGVLQQLPGPAGQRVTGGLVTTYQQQQDLGDDLMVLQPRSFDLRMHQDADQIVGRLLPCGPRSSRIMYSL